ncbi:hypothetical protein L207DRAFT_66063 [Hyaloscypha variabilis F]|uniref:Uncharacterized protein n=1 Tax=Hyaloscypha variabilis (strain UAMH 11265 / GT02V1 / F) TaxID=1149755 RepID=A0A2J6RIG1_HYAVF|nr:hypothetical protein L207DRAFT_66063 [Hyaloscypha variabilis F]
MLVRGCREKEEAVVDSRGVLESKQSSAVAAAREAVSSVCDGVGDNELNGQTSQRQGRRGGASKAGQGQRTPKEASTSQPHKLCVDARIHCTAPKQLHAYIYAYLDCEKRRRMTITTQTMRSTTRCPVGPAGEGGLMEHWPVAVSGGDALEVWSQTLSHRGRHGISCGPQHLGLDAVAATHTNPQRFDSHTERSRIRAAGSSPPRERRQQQQK